MNYEYSRTDRLTIGSSSLVDMSVYRRFRFPVVLAFIAGLVCGVIFNNLNRSTSNDLQFLDDDYERYPDSRSVIRNNVYMNSALFMRYLKEYSTYVDGWIHREIFYVVWVISQYQYEHLNLFGGIGEIGVHHGKFTCFLYLLRRYKEQNIFAIDVFDNQALNKDGSGRGQKETFLKHVREYTQIFRNELAIYSGSSLDLNPVFSKEKKAISWWQRNVVGRRGLQLVSVSFKRISPCYDFRSYQGRRRSYIASHIFRSLSRC